MAYVSPLDFFVKTKKAWCEGLTFGEEAGDTAYLTTVITQIQEQIENDLSDTFEPPTPDNDITLELDTHGGRRLEIPRRVRSITTLKTRDLNGVLTTEASSLWRLTQSATGADFSGNVFDRVDIVGGQMLSTGLWPYGSQTVQIVGKFGWATTPTDIKRLTALLVYDYLKPINQNLRHTEKLQTSEQSFIFVNPEAGTYGIPEADRIRSKYGRQGVLVR